MRTKPKDPSRRDLRKPPFNPPCVPAYSSYPFDAIFYNYLHDATVNRIRLYFVPLRVTLLGTGPAGTDGTFNIALDDLEVTNLGNPVTLAAASWAAGEIVIDTVTNLQTGDLRVIVKRSDPTYVTTDKAPLLPTALNEQIMI